MNKYRQSFLDELSETKGYDEDLNRIKILNWNIGNPSISRAYNQCRWFDKINSDVLVLTESKNSKGCLFIIDKLKSLNYKVFFPEIKEDNYGVIIAAKQNLNPDSYDVNVKLLPHRAPSVVLKLPEKEIVVTGIYIPPTNTKGREEFHAEVDKILKGNEIDDWIILGDLNIPRPDLIVKEKTDQYNSVLSRNIYNSFMDSKLIDPIHFLNKKEYSIERKGKGYRPDNIFISQNLIPVLADCYYNHNIRKLKLSDHSPMFIELNIGRNLL